MSKLTYFERVLLQEQKILTEHFKKEPEVRYVDSRGMRILVMGK